MTGGASGRVPGTRAADNLPTACMCERCWFVKRKCMSWRWDEVVERFAVRRSRP